MVSRHNEGLVDLDDIHRIYKIRSGNVRHDIYMQLRRAEHPWSAKEAWRTAKVLERFTQLAGEGRVRMRVPWDEMPYDAGDLADDPQYMKTLYARIYREGVVGIVFEYKDLEGDWEEAEVSSCWGFIGEDWRFSGSDTEFMQLVIDAAEQVERDRVVLEALHDRARRAGAFTCEEKLALVRDVLAFTAVGDRTKMRILAEAMRI